MKSVFALRFKCHSCGKPVTPENGKLHHNKFGVGWSAECSDCEKARRRAKKSTPKRKTSPIRLITN